jgi:hypothetical protein
MNQINSQLDGKPRIRILTLAILATCLALKAGAQTLVIPPGQQRSLTIPPGKACEMTYLGMTYLGMNPGSEAPFSIVSSGVSNGVADIEGKVVIAGPVALYFHTNYHFAVSYRFFPVGSIETMMIPEQRTNTISLPAGKSFHVLSLSEEATASIKFGLSDGTNSWQIDGSLPLYEGVEFVGPATLSFAWSPVFNRGATAAFLTYYLTEEYSTVPAFGAVQSPTGGYGFNIEKSFNLTNWFPVYLHSTSDDQKAFYRFRIDK